MAKEQMSQLELVQEIFDVLHGTGEADLLMKNLNILDVHGETVYKGSILINRGKVVAVNPDETVVSAREVFDGNGLYAIPGLIDAHFHYESQLANPTALAEVMVPNGTTTIYAEILDLISSAAEEGVDAARKLFKDYDKLPYRLFAFAPGKKVKKEITKEILDMEPVIGLGEFDHHQKNRNGQRKNGIYYSSIGLLWNKFGRKYLESLKVRNIDKTFQYIDE